MKILILSQHFWPEAFPINHVATALTQAGHDVQVLTGKPNYPDGAVFQGYRAGGFSTETYGQAVVRRVPLISRGSGSAARLLLNYSSFITTACGWGPRIIPDDRLEIVLVFASSPLLQAIAGVVVARAKRAKLVVWVQDLWPESLTSMGIIKDGTMNRVVARTARWIYAQCDLILVQSSAFIAPVAALAPGKRIEILANPGVPVAPLPGAHSPGFQLEAGFNIVFAGNFGTAQAMDVILNAADRLHDLSDVRFVLVGSGRESRRLAAAIAARRLDNVVMSGRYAPDAIPAILAQASALLVTLARAPAFRLTVPSKVQTYLAAGKPILAAIDGEAGCIIEQSGAGIVVPAEDAEQLAAAVRTMHAMGADELASLGQAGRAYHDRHFDPAALNARLIGLLRSTLVPQ